MPKSKYNEIYLTLKERIETEEYPFRELIPSENTLIQEFDCSRNTLRRAVQALSTEGYVQSMQGRGVRVIWQKRPSSQFLFGGVESFTEACKRNGIRQVTEVLRFEERVADTALSRLTGMPEGVAVFYIERLRRMNYVPLILDDIVIIRASLPALREGVIASIMRCMLTSEVVVFTPARISL